MTDPLGRLGELLRPYAPADGDLVLTISAAGPVTAVRVVAGGVPVDRFPAEVLSAAADLRAQSADPETGAWFTAEITLGAGGAVAARYDRDEQPAIEPPPPVSAYAEELRRFPRTAEHVPAWLAAAAPDPPPAGPGRPRPWLLAAAVAAVGAVVATALVVLPDGFGTGAAKASAAAGSTVPGPSTATATPGPAPTSLPGAIENAHGALDLPFRGEIGDDENPEACSLDARLTGEYRLAVTRTARPDQWRYVLFLPDATTRLGGSARCDADDPDAVRAGMFVLLYELFTLRVDGRVVPTNESDSYQCTLAHLAVACAGSVPHLFGAGITAIAWVGPARPARVTVTFRPSLLPDGEIPGRSLGGGQVGDTTQLYDWQPTSPSVVLYPRLE